MGYVPGYDHDVFVSYAAIDDKPHPGVRDGWVTTLVNQLQLELSSMLGRTDAFSIWMDRQADHHVPLSRSILRHVQNSATLLIILSPEYVESEWCQDEANTFLESVKARDESGRQVFLIRMRSMEDVRWPNELRNLVGWKFYEQDEPYRPPYGYPEPKDDENYWKQVLLLSHSVASVLRKLKAESSEEREGDKIRTADLSPTKLILPKEVEVLLNTKRDAGEYDVFMCHNNEDKEEIKTIGRQLMSQGILPWLDEWDLRPGLPWQVALEQQISGIHSAVVFVGESSFGPWQNLELLAFLRQFIERQCPVIPVILPSCDQTPKLPPILSGFQFVDFRNAQSAAMERLVWGITGKRPSNEFEF